MPRRPTPSQQGVDDPLGLLDRDLRIFDLRYDTFVSQADEIHRLCTDWYRQYREEQGSPGEAARTDEHHGYFRMIDEYPKWHTARNAWQDAWPLSGGSGGGGGGGGNTGDTPQLSTQRHYFVTPGGGRFTAICCTDFNLQKRVCDGLEIDSVLQQRQDVGFNMVRVFIVGDWGDPRYLCRPQDHPNYYDNLKVVAERCAAHGLYFMACAFCDSSNIFPTLQQQQDHWHRTIEAFQGVPNVLLELVNENDIAINNIDALQFARPSGVLSSHGSNGSQQCAVRPWWDYEVFHTNSAPEEQRKIGHNGMELSTGTPDWRASGVPVITNETSRYPEVGMWRNQSVQNQKMLAYDSAAGYALLVAGGCFHSVNGKLSLPWDGNEIAVARAWVDGARSVPLEFQDGRYTASHLEGITLEPDELRRYARVLGDGRAHWVSIHKTPGVRRVVDVMVFDSGVEE